MFRGNTLPPFPPPSPPPPTLGQYCSQGPITCWRAIPMFRGNTLPPFPPFLPPGQYCSQGTITRWRVIPMFRGNTLPPPLSLLPSPLGSTAARVPPLAGGPSPCSEVIFYPPPLSLLPSPLGQYCTQGTITCWRVIPMFRGNTLPPFPSSLPPLGSTAPRVPSLAGGPSPCSEVILYPPFPPPFPPWAVLHPGYHHLLEGHPHVQR